MHSRLVVSDSGFLRGRRVLRLGLDRVKTLEVR